MGKSKTKSARVYFICLMMIFLLIISGCSTEKNNSGKGKSGYSAGNWPIKMIDQGGHEVIINTQPERIISMSPGNTEILYALGLQDKVVGVTEYCNFPEEAKTKETIGGYENPNIEKIISLKPDLVLAADMHQKPVEQIERFNIPIIVVDPKNIEEMLEGIRLVGKATGCNDKSDELVDSLMIRIKNVQDKVKHISKENKPRVYYEIWPSPFMTAGPGSFVNDIIERAGGVNIASDSGKAYTEYSQELILSKNPDVIIFSHSEASGQTVQELSERHGWENINAVRNGKVYYIDEDIVQRPAPRLMDGLEQLFRILHSGQL
jgi:iron complex transport system substrate-binding protein